MIAWIVFALLIRHKLAYLVAFWLCCEELMVIGCSVAYVLSPWEILPGESQCSALLQFDLGRIGMLLAVVCLLRYVNLVRLQRSNEER